jgi:hypothetical protein
VPVALLVTPEGAAFRSWYPAGTWPLLEEDLRGLCRALGAGFINAREWSAEAEFFDSHHLLAAGARRVTERLARQAGRPPVCPARRNADHAAP